MANYSERQWINPDNHPSTGSVVAYRGEASWLDDEGKGKPTAETTLFRRFCYTARFRFYCLRPLGKGKRCDNQLYGVGEMSDIKTLDPVLFLSGGKDSCGVAARLYASGQKFRAYTFDNGFLSKQAWRNIESVVKVTSCDHFTFRRVMEWVDCYRKDPICKLLDVCAVCSAFQNDYYAAGYKIAGEGGVVITGSDGCDDNVRQHFPVVRDFALRNSLPQGDEITVKVKKIDYWVENEQDLPMMMDEIIRIFSWKPNCSGNYSTACRLVR